MNDETKLRLDRLFRDLGHDCARLAAASDTYAKTQADRDFAVTAMHVVAFGAMVSGVAQSLVQSFAFERAQAEAMVTTYVRVYVDTRRSEPWPHAWHAAALAAALRATPAEVGQRAIRDMARKEREGQS